MSLAQLQKEAFMYGARGQQSQNTIWLGRYGHGVNIASSVLTRCPILNFAFDLMHASARMSSGTIKSQSIFFSLSLSFFHFFLFFSWLLVRFLRGRGTGDIIDPLRHLWVAQFAW